MWKYDSTGAKSYVSNINAFGHDIAFAPDERFRNNLFHADGWEPAADGEAVREWTSIGSQSALVSGLPEETYGLAFGPGGGWGSDLYVAFGITGRIQDPAIRKVTPTGVITDFVKSAEFENPCRLAFDSTANFGGNLFVSDIHQELIFEINPAGEVSTFASGFSFLSAYDVSETSDIVFGPDGAMYVADAGAGTVWRITPAPTTLVDLDIKPGNDLNPVNPKSKGKLPVVLFGSEELDVSTIDLETVLLNGVHLTEKNNGSLFTSLKDKNRDGFGDLVMRFAMQDLGIEAGMDELLLSGNFLDGGAFEGSDIISIVGAGDANGDGIVSADDFASIQANFGATDDTGILGDADGDGLISANDYASVQSNFGATTGMGGMSVPEPATLSLLVIGGLAMLRRRRK